MRQEECYQLGYIEKRHGLHGEVTITLDVDNPAEYDEMDSLFLRIGNQLVPYFIESLRPKPGKKMVAKFEGVDTPEQADGLQGSELFLPLTCLPELEDGQFYYHEVIGFSVVDKTEGQLGTVNQILDGGPQTLMEMEYKGVEILIPMDKDIVIRADKAKKEVQVDLPEGLLDVYLGED
ncbi:ribosome maturation factor RimM [Fulvitalea axinellae]|uniref:Ribosome maturation factor RimM n=1 Tax=Fulvitalea axinellae TaxID=1182444 RepID=A0AAU9CW55_9BACT|nr:ribosome maturation factor RimM [Fulvitalea axinellae]